MGQDSANEQKTERRPVERLVEVADAIFERTNKLANVKLSRKGDDATKTISDTRDEGYVGVISVWRIILDMLPTSGMEFAVRKELEIDAYKIISRCHHRLGNHEKAISAITKAIDLGYTDGFISLGAIYIDLEDYKGAEAAFMSALAKDAQTTRAHAGLAELYFAMGTNALKNGDTKHIELFEKSEEEFIAAGRERFEEAFERAMDLFEKIGWKDKAMSIGAKAVQYYSNNRLKYGDRLRTMDSRLRKIAGNERYERILAGVGRRLGDIVGGRDRDPNH